MQNEILQIHFSVLPGEGEDSFAVCSHEHGTLLCVTDGCGGLGSRRYAALDNKTGAYIASRLAARAFARWVEERLLNLPAQEQLQPLCREAERALFEHLKGFAEVHCSESGSRITGSMQRRLPTTLCALTAQGNDLCFWWAGDSRGYVLDDGGLHQFTKDHLRGQTDAFEMLYRDLPLSNLLCADQKGRIALRSLNVIKPSVVIVATDGVYSSLPTPMEVEMLLLDTLKPAKNMNDWERRLSKRIAANAQDDATLLLMPVGFDDFVQMKDLLLLRREALKKQFITPVRRHKGDIAYARVKWLQYKPGYDCTEELNE